MTAKIPILRAYLCPPNGMVLLYMGSGGAP